MDVSEAIVRLHAGHRLSAAESEEVFDQVMEGEGTPAQIAALLVLLSARGETIGEVVGAARSLRRRAVRVETALPVIDTCGTGGDGRGTINVSTAAALVAAAAGARVAKHGNRAMSGSVGGADVLEALGVDIDLDPERASQCLYEVGITFLLAPRYHPAMARVAPVRRELRIRTIFNLLGPLCNPAGVRRQVVGVFGARWVETMAQALAELGAEHAFVLHGEEGLDEISPEGPTILAEVRSGKFRRTRIAPEELGLERHPLREVVGTDARGNARAIRAVLEGRGVPAHRDFVLLNAAPAMVVAGLAGDLREGVDLARRVLQEGAAAALLERWAGWGRGGLL